MPLTQKAIDELKEIYKEEFKVDLPDKEAWEMGHRILGLFDIVLRPLTEDNKNSQNPENSGHS